MRLFVFLFLMLPLTVLAQQQTQGSGIDGFWGAVMSYFGDFWNVLTVEVPGSVARFFAWVIEWGVLLKLHLQLEGIKFGWQIAKVIIEDLSFGSQVNVLLDALPNDLRAFLSIIRLVDALELLFTAHITRFVMSVF